MTAPEPQHADPDGDAAARACLTAVAPPGSPLMGALLDEHDAREVWEALRSGSALPRLSGSSGEARPGQRAAQWKRWQDRARALDADALLSDTAELGGRVVAPGSPEWPTQLDMLAGHRPYALWVRGAHDLRNACLRAVSLVGARAASGYGLHVAGELAHTLARRGTATVSGGAYGIDAAAHRGALAAGGATVVVLACGLDVGYPSGHENLFADVAANGTLVTEYPLGSRPNRGGFLVRNRVIAALSPGTVVVEAGLRSGAMNTARHAHELHRVLMAVPKPVPGGSAPAPGGGVPFTLNVA
ncbi:DNA processing protein [Haloactinospora alba]|uniref:DNA processing protein n=1 Tax=Haloactinospora alba TaxID=405555 RepID=A0A543NFV2_9ACTN|nr:DNA processing protein [Haloactinospora alba]